MKLILSIFLLICATEVIAFKATVTSPIYTPLAEDIQGITQTTKNWYISNQFNIYKIPKSRRLIPKNFYPNLVKNYPSVQIPQHLQELGYNHFGGISVYKEFLLVALERKKPMKILFFDLESLDYQFAYDVPMEMNNLSWVAGAGDKIYFSEHIIGPDRYLYELNPETMELKKSRPKAPITKIQGGTYSAKENKIYFACDSGSRVGGIYSIELKTMNVKHEVGIIYNRGFPAYQEIEGLTFHDSKNAEKITLLLLDNNLFEDSFHFIEISNFIND